MQHKGYAVAIIIFLLLAWHTWNNEKELNENKLYTSNTVTQTKANQTNIIQASTHQNIEQTLLLVAKDYRNKVDVNKDRKINCIDAAVLFYQYYPVKTEVCIMLNKNDSTDMFHLFNCVLIDGVWRAIEPQAYTDVNWQRLGIYYMRDIWGSRYDSNLNRDVTDNYLRFVR